MHRTEHRTWFPFILVGLTVALAAIIWAWPFSSEQNVGQSSPEQEISTPTYVEYQSQVIAILEAYLETDDEQSAYTALLDVWVPVEAKEVHLDLVVAFGKLAAGDENGAELVDQVRASHLWLP